MKPSDELVSAAARAMDTTAGVIFATGAGPTPRALARAALDAVYAQIWQEGFDAGQRSIDEALVAVSSDSDRALSLYYYDGEWGAQQQIVYLEESFGTGICGHGDRPTAAILDACAKAKEGAGE